MGCRVVDSMSSFKLITVIVTAYNHERFVARALKSAISQTGAFRYEIIVSDDGSTDLTHSIIASFARRYPWLISNISSPITLGISGSMKKCISASNGDYISFLDGDDFFLTNRKLQDQLEFMENNQDCAMCFSGSLFYDTEMDKFTEPENQAYLPEKLNGHTLCELANPVITFSATFFRGDIIRNIPDCLYDGVLSEFPLALYCENFGKIGFVSEKHVAYRQHENNTWGSLSERDKTEWKLATRLHALEVCLPQVTPYLANEISWLHKRLAEIA